MKIVDTRVNGAIKIIENFYAFDIRGGFIKIFNEDTFNELGVKMDFAETYYSISHKDTIRGMHFQMPPFEHDKLIHVIKGSVVDIVLDLRKDSPTFKQYTEIKLTGNKPKSIYIPKGFAHGFKALEDNTIMLYNVSSGYSSEHDCGIRWDSIGYDWAVEEPIISERDRTFASLDEFKSPF
jgi:dTDP-4-dehydrorhamnose 3,5-epimerase